MDQKIVTIDIAELVLWTENPRDPVDVNAKDQDIANKAWTDAEEKWNLMKLVKEMKSHYDLSELPTVVMHNEKPIVYDGNRRMILAKLKHSCINLLGFDITKLPEIPKKIPCNVCIEKIAVENVFRKHGDSGSWSPLDRDLFTNKFLLEPKTTFLKLDEATGLISANPHLNKVFVKNEIFTSDKLKELGFEFNGDELHSVHSKVDANTILNDITDKIVNKKITTRSNRGKVIDILEKKNRDLIENNKNNLFQKIDIDVKSSVTLLSAKRQAARTKNQPAQLFNGQLYLKPGQVSDLYRDIVDLYNYYQDNKSQLSQYFPSLIRISMRLLSEAAASDQKCSLDDLIKSNFKNAKSKLDPDSKTTLSTQNVSEGSLVQLLHVGAHKYKAANNLDQTIAVSIIIGEILTITHGR